MFERDDGKDSFWDVSKLVPKKKPSVNRFSTNEKTSDVIIGENTAPRKETGENKINFNAYEATRVAETDKVATRSYIPKNSKLIKSVTIKPSPDRFDFYDTFRKGALIYFEYKCSKCEFAPFYSYKPQYSQMNTEQKKYYFYWRDEVRRGRYPKTDYSYVYLYAYEILNLPEKISKEDGLRMLCNVWAAYRKDLPRIDVNFAQWVQDYCLVYEMECPFDRLREFLFDVINASSFKEFYLSDINENSTYSAAMIAYLSDYDWRRGKYACGEHADAYRANIEGAMQRVFALLLADERISCTEPKRVTRTAFPGSLCTHSVKCILELDYYSVADSSELREIVTAAIKYTENKLRACLGVKSRLAIKHIPDDVKAVIDGYFESEFERQRRERERANAPEYERLYDSPEESISFENALEIERASWNVTARLVEGIDDYEDTSSASERDVDYQSLDGENADYNRNSSESGKYGLFSYEIDFLRAVLYERSEDLKQICANHSTVPEAVVERINEAFSDNFGDVVIEQTQFGFEVIDDYTEEIIEWLQ